MFNIELKFVCDALQKWFAGDLKKVEIDEVAKFNFLMNNVPQICEICDFPINPFAETGWFQHVCSAEYLYLENIYSKKDMFKVNINEFEEFLCKVKKVLDNLEEFCSSLEIENDKSCQEDVSNEELNKIKADISNTRTSRQDKKEEGPTKEKTVGYLYKKSIRFLKNDNIDLEMPYSDGFLANLSIIASSRPVVHHCQTSCKIVGFVHEFCNLKVRENYYTILDVFILLVKNLNPFSLPRKISDKFKHKMIYMLWRECIPPAFYRFICQEDNFRYLNGRDVSQPGVLKSVSKFVDQDKNNLRLLQQCLANYKDILQYVYSCTYPEIYTMSEKTGIDMKSNFYILFKMYKDKMMMKRSNKSTCLTECSPDDHVKPRGPFQSSVHSGGLSLAACLDWCGPYLCQSQQ